MTQDEALAILKTGTNIFLTGEPGSGKTYTINQYVSWLRERGVASAITASTGIAATHINGYTIHSWSGIGVRKDLSDRDLNAIVANRRVAKRILTAQVLIIDEISMLSARTFAMVDAVCRRIRHDERPFGGLQAILVGDFFQLPPVFPREAEGQEILSFRENDLTQFAYTSPAWNSMNPVVCYLSEQHRQEDPAFLELLSAIRRSAFLPAHRGLLRKRYAPTPRGVMTQLYSHNADVDRINDAELAKISGQMHSFEMVSRGPERLVAGLKRGCLSPEHLHLKIGARVMFTKNDTLMHRFVNGTLGVVAGFSKETGYPIVRTNMGRTVHAEPMEWSVQDGNRVLAAVIQISLRLAWAITVHKSQGMSLDAAHMDLSNAFEYGQGYVALSRVRTLAGLSLAGLNDRALEVHPEVSVRDTEFREQSQRTRERFAKLQPIELTKLQDDFVKICSGMVRNVTRA